MALWSDIKQRRISQIFLSYLVGGWILLQVVDQVVDRDVLPRYVYVVALLLFGFGIPAALIIGWYHGEKGAQKATGLEVAMLSVLAIGAVSSSIIVVQSALRVQAAQSGRIDLARMAVLYFTATDEETAVVADGVTEDLIDRLSQVPQLDVISRNGSRQVRDQALTLEEAADFLEVGTVLDGDVRRSGGEIVVSVALRTADDVRVANVSARGPADDLVVLQNNVAAQVEEEILQAVGEEIRLRETRSQAPNNGAWLAVARGERALERALASGGAARAGGLDEAEASFTEATELAPDWSEGWVRRSQVAYDRGRFAGRDREAADSLLRAAVALADQALSRDPRAGEAVFLRGSAHYVRYLMGLDETAAQTQVSLDLARDDLETAAESHQIPDAYARLSHLYYQVEDPIRAALAARQAYESDAFLASGNQVLERLFLTNYDLEDAEQSEEWCNEGYRRFPEDYFFTECRLYLMTMPGVEPDIAWAWALKDSTAAIAGPETVEERDAEWTQVVGGVIARAGLPDSASAVMDRAPGVLSIEAAMRIMNGEHEKAVDLLLTYTAGTGGHFSEGTGLMWWWRPLQGRPEFERLRRLN